MKLKFLLIFIIASAIFGLGCSNYLDVLKGNWKLIESEHFNYYYQKNLEKNPEYFSGAIQRLEWFWDFAAEVWDYGGQTRNYYYFL